jgi:uncharacterized membrane protein
LEFIDALKRAMEGLPIEAQAKTLAYYEQRFVDGAAAGMPEDEIIADLGDPRKIAMSLRASTHAEALQQAPRRGPASAVRVLFAAIGLAIFNLFMIIPGAVYASLLAALYACTLAFYGSGIVIAASGVAGANEITLDAPLRHIIVDDDIVIDGRSPTRIVIDDSGIKVSEVPDYGSDDENDSKDATDRVIDRAEKVASDGIQISTEMDDASRTKLVLVGLGLVLLGIGLALMSIVVTRWTFVGLKRYAQMNLSLLRGQ